MKLFVTKSCPKCEIVKRRLAEMDPAERPDIDILDMGTAEGLALAAYYEITLKTAPILLDDRVRIISDLDKILAEVGA